MKECNAFARAVINRLASKGENIMKIGERLDVEEQGMVYAADLFIIL